jgi:uncharacterized protein YciI
MIRLTYVLGVVLAIAGNHLPGNSVHAGPIPHPEISSEPQDQSALSTFAASLTKYYVGFVHSGPKWTAEVDEVTKQNRAYLKGLVDAKKLVGAGQVTDGKDLRWILFFKGDSLMGAKKEVADAPAVKAGRVTGEVRQMWGTRGVGARMEGADKMEAMGKGPKITTYLVVLKKGPKWSGAQNDTTRTMLQSHISHAIKLHQDGALKFYGAFDDKGDIRGFGVLHAESVKAAKKLMEDDPALKADWFVAEYYTFEVAEGLLP